MALVYSLLQKRIENIYRIQGTPQVQDFCIEEEHLEQLGSVANGIRREALLIHEDDESLDLGLFVATHVRKAVERFLGTRGSEDASALLDPFCVALEGVSHFVYVTFSSNQSRPVSLIELELQAEVDKYLVLRLQFGITNLVETLFEHIRFEDSLTPEELDRYRVANDRARSYARWLERKIQRGETHSALEDARRLYRKPFHEKLEHIARAA